MKIRTISRRIALVGTVFSGKTVFLTSLINHLRDHVPADFSLGRRTRIRRFREIDVPNGWGHKFPYAKYREAMVRNGKWPVKTRDHWYYVGQFDRSDWILSDNRVEFLDFPGERVADALIAACNDHAMWSDRSLDFIKGNSEYAELAAPFLEELDREVPPDIRLRTYRDFLAALHLRGKPLVSPSTFLLDLEGRSVEGDTLDTFREGCRNRPLGLPGHEFVPLSAEARDRNGALAREYAKAYAQYRSQVVLPFFTALESSHRLIVLVDVATILCGGVGLYNDTRGHLEQLFQALDPSSTIGRALKRVLRTLIYPLSFLFGSGGGIDRVAFVATKHDLVLPQDRANLKALLEELVRKPSDELEGRGIESRCFTTSAMVSARPTDDADSLRGRIAKGNPGLEERIFKVSRVPAKWPADWKPGDYRFSRVHPSVPANHALAPRQEGLDRVFEFISRD